MGASPKALALAKLLVGKALVPSDPQDEFQDLPGQPRVEEFTRSKQLPTLFDYQSDLVNLARGVLQEGQSGLISLPTGGGKTRTATYLLLDYVARNSEASLIWLAPTIELLDQAHDTIATLWRDFGVVGDILVSRKLKAPLAGARIWLTTPQGLNAKMQEAKNVNWDAIFFDEAHQLAAPTFKKAVETIRQFSPSAALIGLTATPGRTQTGEVDSLTQIFNGRLLISPTLGKHPVEFLQRRGVLSRLDFRFLQDESADFMGGEERLRLAVEKVAEVAGAGHKSLVFTASLVESEAVSLALNSIGVRAHHVEGAQKDDLRRAIIGDFAKGKCSVLTNQKLLTTGYDCPAVSNVFLTSKVNSPILFEQMVGRAARGTRTGGSRRSTIWQFDDHLAIHGLPQSYYRYKDYEWSLNQT